MMTYMDTGRKPWGQEASGVVLATQNVLTLVIITCFRYVDHWLITIYVCGWMFPALHLSA